MERNEAWEQGKTRITRGVTVMLIGVGLDGFLRLTGDSSGVSILTLAAVCWGLFDIVRGLMARKS